MIEIDDKYKDMISDINPRKGSILNDIILDAAKNGTVLPEHGRLIDADELKKAFVKNEIPYYAWEIVKNAPTILGGVQNEC